MTTFYSCHHGRQPTLSQILGIGIIPWKPIILVFLLADFLFDVSIQVRQRTAAKNPEPPAVLAGVISRATSAKSSPYEVAKLRLAAWKRMWHLVVDVTITMNDDVLATMWMYSGVVLHHLPGNHVVSQSMGQSLVFTLLYLLFMKVISLPFDAAETFLVEQSFACNNQTLAGFFLDFVKESLLILAIAPLPLAITLNVVTLAGDNLLLYVWPTWVVIQFVLASLGPIIFLPLFNKLSPLPDGSLKTKSEVLAEEQGFPLKSLYVMDGSTRSSHSNAFFYGFPWQMHIVVYDTLLSQSENDEIVAVLAHELGHWKYGHHLRLLIVAQLCWKTYLSL
jgi:STE24 endopeptidase